MGTHKVILDNDLLIIRNHIFYMDLRIRKSCGKPHESLLETFAPIHDRAKSHYVPFKLIGYEGRGGFQFFLVEKFMDRLCNFHVFLRHGNTPSDEIRLIDDYTVSNCILCRIEEN